MQIVESNHCFPGKEVQFSGTKIWYYFQKQLLLRQCWLQMLIVSSTSYTQLTNQHIVLSVVVQGEVNWMVSVVDPHVPSLEK